MSKHDPDVCYVDDDVVSEKIDRSVGGLDADDTWHDDAADETRCAQPSRRQFRRRRLASPAVIVPVQLDLGPGAPCWTAGATADVSPMGISISLHRRDALGCRLALVGIGTGRDRRFGTMTIRSQTLEGGKLRVGGSWVIGGEDDLLDDRKLRPFIDPHQLRFRHALSEDVLLRWKEIGVLRSYLLDRVLLCSRCDSLPSWRMGCHRCGSGRFQQDRLIHHFACAHVGPAEELETATGLQCPKCRTRHLIVGSDYEYIDGPLTCLDCGASGGQPTMSAMCHRCHVRFDSGQAKEVELMAYHASRIDPMELFAMSDDSA